MGATGAQGGRRAAPQRGHVRQPVRVGGPPPHDRRLARGDRTRLALVESLLLLAGDDPEGPTIDRVADGAGVAPRTVYHHFGGLPALLVAAVGLQSARHRHLLGPATGRNPLRVRLVRLCQGRRAYYEEVGAVQRVAQRWASRHPAVEEALAAERLVLRSHLAGAFAPELERRGSGARLFLDSLDHASGWEEWVVLRDVRHHSAASAQQVFTFIVTRMFL